MPESKVRKGASAKRKDADHKAEVEARGERRTRAPGTSQRWVAPLFIATGLLGIIWIVVFNLARQYVPFMDALGNWNFAIGIGLMALAFIISTQWK